MVPLSGAWCRGSKTAGEQNSWGGGSPRASREGFDAKRKTPPTSQHFAGALPPLATAHPASRELPLWTQVSLPARSVRLQRQPSGASPPVFQNVPSQKHWHFCSSTDPSTVVTPDIPSPLLLGLPLSSPLPFFWGMLLSPAQDPPAPPGYVGTQGWIHTIAHFHTECCVETGAASPTGVGLGAWEVPWY